MQNGNLNQMHICLMFHTNKAQPKPTENKRPIEINRTTRPGNIVELNYQILFAYQGSIDSITVIGTEVRRCGWHCDLCQFIKLVFSL